MRSGRLDKWVTLYRSPQQTNDADGFFEPLSPSGCWAQLQPGSPAATDGRSLSVGIVIRWHPQVTLDTKVSWVDPNGVTHDFFVRGIQDVNYDNVEMRLICEEIQP